MSVLEVRGLSKRFGPTQAVREVSIHVEAGSIHGLLGPNGSGKTTSLACALGLLRPDAGEITILGQPSRRIDRTLGKVGVVLDSAALLPGLTVRDNLEYSRKLLGHPGGRGIDEALELVGMAGFAGRRAGRMSLGQQKRVAIARCLLGSPELLVLDEPLSALDALGVRDLLRLFRRLADEGLTLVLSSHRMPEMESIVTHATILLAGRVATEGPIDELLGGGSARYRLAAGPRDEVRRVLDGLQGAEVVGDADLPGHSGPALRVALDGVDAPALVRELVGAGCDVSALAPERQSLRSLFEELADREADA